MELRLRRPLTPSDSGSATGLSDSGSLCVHVGTDRSTLSRRIRGRTIHRRVHDRSFQRIDGGGYLFLARRAKDGTATNRAPRVR